MAYPKPLNDLMVAATLQSFSGFATKLSQMFSGEDNLAQESLIVFKN
jgi:hypothetical protein